MKIRERPPKPIINIAKKINIKSKRNKKYIAFINEFESNPLHYFDSKFDNKPFIIGRSYSQSPNAKDADLSFSNIRTMKYGVRRRTITKTAKIFLGNKNKAYITNHELALIYEHADGRLNEINTETEAGKNTKRPLSQFHYHLKQQENSLKHYNSFTKKRDKLTLSISKKINCNPDMLLMNKQELYRPKKEVLNSISYNDLNTKVQFECSLRQNTSPNINLGKNNNSTILIRSDIHDTMLENTKGKIALCKPKEIIRNPSYDMLYCNNNILFNNTYLRNKFASLDSFESSVNKPNINLKRMKIRGVNLLILEKSIAEKLKGQKILYLEKRISDFSSINSQTIADKSNKFAYAK